MVTDGAQLRVGPTKGPFQSAQAPSVIPRAAAVFADPFSITIADPVHSSDEERQVLIGATRSLRLVVVVHTERGDRIRIISARQATRAEQEQYEQQEK
jgi:uncharacterized DUF497 family protein